MHGELYADEDILSSLQVTQISISKSALCELDVSGRAACTMNGWTNYCVKISVLPEIDA